LKDEKELSFKPLVNNTRVVEKDFFKRMERDQDRKREKIEKLKSSIAPSFKPTINSETIHLDSTY
jgi:chaperonin cofactor prefoldin